MGAFAEFGGVAGTRAVIEDLEQAQLLLTRATRALRHAADAIGLQRGLFVQDRSMMADSIKWQANRTEEALDALDRPSSGARTLEEHADLLRARLNTTAQGYLEAERASQWVFTRGARNVRAFHDLLGTGMWVVRASVATVWRLGATTPRARLGLDAVGQEMMPHGAPPTSGYLAMDTTQGFTQLLANAGMSRGGYEYSNYMIALTTLRAATGFLNALMGREHPIGITVQDPDQQPPVAQSFTDLVAAMQKVSGDPLGAVGVQTVTGADGKVAYVVTVPGTESWMPGHPTAAGPEGNSDAMAWHISELMVQVDQAMEAAGVPPGAPVMLQGHSQGGIASTLLAVNSTFARKYNVTHVFTVGAPAGHFPHRSNVEYLHVANIDDVVPGLGSGPPPDQSNVTSNIFEMEFYAEELPEDPRTLTGAHALDNYAVLTEYLDQDPGTSTQAWLESAGAFMGDDKTATYMEAVPAYPLPVEREVLRR